MIRTVGSVCSGIEAASVSWKKHGFIFQWFSEIAPFPSEVLKTRQSLTPNIGDMTLIPNSIIKKDIEAPDLICGGTPCQAFSLAGLRAGLSDDRGNLTLKFAEIINASDEVRTNDGRRNSIVFWENVEGVLSDKTNAFGCFIAYLAGVNDSISVEKWGKAGFIHGPKRNVAWRVLDAKFFGVPQQRKRLYVLAGGTDFYPENVLFELYNGKAEPEFPKNPLVFEKGGHSIEVFREYTDCLYSAYGTKWNGNAAATNGSLFVSQDGRLRRMSPLEAERLMGFPDNYTLVKGSTNTSRYQAVGNSWAVPVIEWIGQSLKKHLNDGNSLIDGRIDILSSLTEIEGSVLCNFDAKYLKKKNRSFNVSPFPNEPVFSDLYSVIDVEADQRLYITPTACYGILRRKRERGLPINKRLEQILIKISSEETFENIEKRSLIQKRGNPKTNK